MSETNSALYGVFRYQDQHLAVSTEYIREVVPFGDVRPVLGGNENLLGATNIRGSNIPVADLAFYGIQRSDEAAPNAILVLIHQQRCFGIALSEVIKLASNDSGQVTHFADTQNGLTFGIYRDEDSQVTASILNVDWLFERANIPSVVSSMSHQVKPTELIQRQTSYFFVQCEKHTLGIESEQVFATTQVSHLSDATVSSHVVLGEIEYLDQMVPAVDLYALIFNQRRETPLTQGLYSVIIVASPNDKLIAYLVDEIMDIKNVCDKDFVAYPQEDFIGKEWITSLAKVPGHYSKQRDILLLKADINKLKNDPRVLGIANVCRAISQDASNANGSNSTQLNQERESLLLFERNGVYCVRLSAVVEIKMSSIPIVFLPEDPKVIGFFEHNGQSLMLYDFEQLISDDNKLTSVSSCDDSKFSAQRILIVQGQERQRAFLVDRLIDICEGTKMQRKPRQSEASETEPVSNDRLCYYLVSNNEKKCYVKCLDNHDL